MTAIFIFIITGALFFGAIGWGEAIIRDIMQYRREKRFDKEMKELEQKQKSD